MPHILIIDAPYYTHISQKLREGAEAVLKEQGATWDYIAVPGVFEIPAAVGMAAGGDLLSDWMESGESLLETIGISSHNDNADGDFAGGPYDGFVTLGCVIRGETTHYEIVAVESARALMNLSVELGLALGNGIQTVENEAQALVRASRDQLDKGGHAAQAALDMIKVRAKLDI